MALRRCARSVDGTIPIQALLYNDEEVYASQDGVGIYDGYVHLYCVSTKDPLHDPQKSPNHQAGIVFISTHRIFYIDAHNPFAHSFFMSLSYITQTECYSGLFKSSPKVTLHLSGNTTASGQDVSHELETGFESWECEVCAYRNPPGLSPAASRICGLCGVPRSSVPASIPSVLPRHLSTSLPSSSVPSALSSSSSLSTGPGRHGLQPEAVACSACTFLNHPSLRVCEMCSTELPQIKTSRSQRSMKSAPSSRPASPDYDEVESTNTRMIKISFRKGGDKAFYAMLKRSLKGKVWEAHGIGKSPNSNINGLDDAVSLDRSAAGRSGISGILRTVETSAQDRAAGMTDALQDLEALMVKARDMVGLAAELNDKLTAASTSAALQSTPPLAASSSTAVNALPEEPEEATFIRSSLSQLGLQMPNAPVTLDMIKDERRWIEELARELAQVLQGSLPSNTGRGMMKDRGIIALDEVWGGWNRARGVALIPPSTFLLVVPQLPTWTEPIIQLRTFSSGLSVLHTPPYSHAAFTARLSGLLALKGPRTTMEVAREEGITVSLSEEMIAAVEADGVICRDDGITGAELVWWVNLFVGYEWDGQ